MQTLALHPDRKAIVFLMAHGTNHESKHRLKIQATDPALRDTTNRYWTSTSTFFDGLAKARNNQPVEIYMPSCFGGAAACDISRLPKGSKVVFLSDASETTPGWSSGAPFDFLYAAKELFPQNFGIESVYLAHLATVRDQKRSTLHTDAGVIDPRDVLFSMAGKESSPDSAQRIHNALDSFWGKDEVSFLIKQIEQSASASDLLRKENAHEYLAIAFASRTNLKTSGDNFELVKKMLAEIATDYEARGGRENLDSHHRSLSLGGLVFSLAGHRENWPEGLYDHLVSLIKNKQTGRVGRHTAYNLLKSRTHLPERVIKALMKITESKRDRVDQYRTIHWIPDRVRFAFQEFYGDPCSFRQLNQ